MKDDSHLDIVIDRSQSTMKFNSKIFCDVLFEIYLMFMCFTIDCIINPR